MSITLYAPAGRQRAVFSIGVYDTSAAGTITIPSSILMEALQAGYLYSVNVAGSIYRGALACAADPAYPAGFVGDQYCVSTAGHVGGASGPLVQVGDFVICLIANVGGIHAAVGADWQVLQANVSKSVEGPASTVTASSLVGFDGTTGALIKEISALPNNTTATTLLVTTLDTNVAAAGVTVAGTTVAADGTDADISITITPKGAGSAIISKADINGGTVDGVALNDVSIAGVTKYWNPAKETLQALITSIADATATKVYTIVVPPGHIPEADITASTPLLLKGYVNLKGAGGAGRATIFHNVGVSFLDAGMVSGINRLRIEGIRFETCPIIMTASTHQMVVTMVDCPINGVSSIKFTGTSYATYSALEMINLNIDNNTTANLYKFAHVSFWSCTLLGLYFEDSDAYFNGCDISSGCNCVNAGVAGGWFEFNHCKIDQMTTGDEASESVLATFGVGGSENIQVHGSFTGLTAPGSVSAFIRMRGGVQYFCTTNYKLYVKTAAVGTNTWAVVGAQS